MGYNKRPSKVSSSRFHDLDPNAPIVVERRQIVATIEAGNGPETMMQAAFRAICDALGESLTDGVGDQMEFSYGIHKFTVAADPIEFPNEAANPDAY